MDASFERSFWQFGSKWSPPLARETPNYFRRARETLI